MIFSFIPVKSNLYPYSNNFLNRSKQYFQRRKGEKKQLKIVRKKETIKSRTRPNKRAESRKRQTKSKSHGNQTAQIAHFYEESSLNV
ncbi:hypothetical protein HQ29_07630 [Porphyromonas canoris]|nr:hypothetical protein HQ29_07630 [Porphyromonas canoris]